MPDPKHVRRSGRRPGPRRAAAARRSGRPLRRTDRVDRAGASRIRSPPPPRPRLGPPPPPRSRPPNRGRVRGRVAHATRRCKERVRRARRPVRLVRPSRTSAGRPPAGSAGRCRKAPMLGVRRRAAVECQLDEDAPEHAGVLEAVGRPETDHDARRIGQPIDHEVAIRGQRVQAGPGQDRRPDRARQVLDEEVAQPLEGRLVPLERPGVRVDRLTADVLGRLRVRPRHRSGSRRTTARPSRSRPGSGPGRSRRIRRAEVGHLLLGHGQRQRAGRTRRAAGWSRRRRSGRPAPSRACPRRSRPRSRRRPRG